MKRPSLILIVLITSFKESLAELTVSNKLSASLIPDCVIQIIRTHFNQTQKISIRHKPEYNLEVTELSRKIQIPVIINTDEIPKIRGLEKRMSNQVEIIMDDMFNVTDTLMRTLWVAQTQFFLILRNSSDGSGKLLNIFNQFFVHNIFNIMVLIDQTHQVFIYGFSPYRNCKNNVDQPVLLSIYSSGNFEQIRKEEVAAWRSVSDLKGCPINVTVMDFPPLVVFLNSDDTHGTNVVEGIEGNALIEVSRRMNFVPWFAVPKDGQPWGWIEPEPHGVVGEVYSGVSDFGFSMLAPTMERYENLDISVPISSALECITWGVPIQAGKHQEMWINILVEEFPMIIWYCIIVAIVVISVIFRRLLRLFPTDKLKLDSYLQSFFYTISALFGVPVTIPTTLSVRVLFSSWIWYCFIIAVAYQSSMGSKLTVPTAQPDIDTFKDLLASDLYLTGHANAFKLFQCGDEDEDVKAISKRVQGADYGVLEGIRRVVFERNIAYMTGTTAFMYNSMINEKTKGRVHIMQQCVYVFLPSMVLKKRSPLTARVNFILGTLFEAGVTKHWRSRYLYDVPVPPPPVVSLSLHHLTGPFVTLCVGNLLAFLGFLSELIYFNFLKWIM